MANRATRLHFVGPRDHDGRPLEFFAFVPARDLDEGETASLTDEQYAAMTEGDPPLYAADAPKPVAARLAPAAYGDADDGEDD